MNCKICLNLQGYKFGVTILSVTILLITLNWHYTLYLLFKSGFGAVKSNIDLLNELTVMDASGEN